MALNVWQRYVADDAGNVLASPSIEVRSESSGSLVSVYADRDGNTALGNPFTGGADGFVKFYVAAGRYKIEATSGGETATFRDVLLGGASGYDVGTAAGEVPTNGDLGAGAFEAITTTIDPDATTGALTTDGAVVDNLASLGLGLDANATNLFSGDMDALTRPGIYAVNPSANGATANPGICIVARSHENGKIAQKWLDVPNVANDAEYRRSKASDGTWSGWKVNVTEGNVGDYAAAPVQGATAWVNFDGTGTVSIRDSYNVDSITDSGSGNYIVNFETAMSNSNYCTVTVSSEDSSGSLESSDAMPINLTTSSFGVQSGSGTTLADRENIFALVLGGIN